MGTRTLDVAAGESNKWDGDQRALAAQLVGRAMQGCKDRLLPQVAFVTRALAGELPKKTLDFAGHIEAFEYDWHRIRNYVKDWPKPTFSVSHPKKLAEPHQDSPGAGFIHNGRSHAAITLKVALCRVLLPDYICFGYD